MNRTRPCHTVRIDRASGAVWSALALVAAVASAILPPAPATAQCTDPPGDVNADGVVNVVDVQCATLTALWYLATDPSLGLPACVNEEPTRADTNCDGVVTVADVQILINYSLGLPLGAAIDANASGCPDTCEPETPGPGTGDLVITEIMINPQIVSDGVGEWFEIRNATSQPISLQGLVIRDDATDYHVVQGDVIVQAGAHFVLGRVANPSTNGGVPVQYAYGGDMLFHNTADQLILEFGGQLVDRVDYDATFPGGLGFAMALDPSAGDHITNDLAEYWCAATTTYGLGGLGTPGAQNEPCFECGNGILEPGQECDDGSANSDTEPNACRTDCTLPSCGDGVCDTGETCANCDVDCGLCGPVLCGGARCRADQVCDEGVCRFPCQGARVPGDYASISSAVSALASVGGTICVAEGVYDESLTISATAALTIQGVSAALTVVQGQITLNNASGSGAWVLRGLTSLGGVRVNNTNNNHPVLLQALRVARTGSSTSAHGVDITRNSNRPQVVIDGCDINGTANSAAVHVADNLSISTSLQTQVEVRNSFLHDSAFGVRYRRTGGSSFPNTVLELRNNTVNDCTVGLQTEGTSTNLSLRYYNSLFTGHQVAVELLHTGGSPTQRAANAFHANVVNFAGAATPALNDIFSDPLVDGLAVPPEPTPASPLLGAALTTQAPALDYWGIIRDTEPDIGAVEGLCDDPPCQAVGTPGCGDGVCSSGETCATCPEDCGACNPSQCGTCHDKQQCVAGTCQYVCIGAHVPGDYASVAEAVAALSPMGGTICVGAGQFPGNVTVSASSPLTIQGLSPDLTFIEGQITYLTASSAGDWILRGATVTGGVRVINTPDNHPVRLEGLRIFRTGTSSAAHGVEITRTSNRPQVLIDGCDVVGTPNSSAVEVLDNLSSSTSAQMQVEVRNCFLHDSGAGLRYRRTGGSFPNTALILRNNTVLDCGEGFLTSGSSTSLNLSYYNNLFSGHSTAIELTHTGGSPVQHGNNAFFGNQVNYGGAAVPSAGDVYADPLLDSLQVPPAPSAASPLLGAALANQASAADFWGRSRDAEPDIGAVERQCTSPPCQPVGSPGCGDGVCSASESCATCPQDCGACDPAQCGTCHEGQFCIDGACQYVCDGANVPGDYGSVAEAVSALSPVGGTICVGAGTFPGNVTVQATAPLAIQGRSPDLTFIDGQITFLNASGSGEWGLRGLTLTGGVRVSNTNNNHLVRLEGLRIFRAGTSSTAQGVEVIRTSNRPQVIIEGCDIVGTPNSAAVDVVDTLAISTSLQMQVQVRDSFLHDSGYGVRYRRTSGSSFPNTALTVRNNTILDCGEGLFTTGTSTSLSLTYYNNVFAGHGMGVELTHSGGSPVMQGFNAFYGNEVNYGGSAVPSVGDVYADPLLDLLQVPPAPGPASPLLGAALASQATEEDYWGRARDSAPDIGAVERQCASPPCVAVGTPGCGDGVCAAAETCATCPQDCGACDPSACGPCHEGQLCVAGACQYVCQGASVPGDYVEISAAVAALAPVGGTICVGAGTFSGNVNVQATAPLTIQGLSPALTVIDGQITFSNASGSGEWVLRGATVASGVRVTNTNTNHPVRLEGLRIYRAGTSSTAHGLEITRSSNRPDVLVLGCDITGTPNSAAVDVVDNLSVSTSLQAQIELHNCYLHNSAFGVRYRRAGGSSFPNTSIGVRNNTIMDCSIGLSTLGTSVSLTLAYFNNVLVGHDTGVELTHSGGSPVQHGHNAFFGNVVNFGGAAVPSAADVFANPLLDELQVPPAPSPASPLLGGALASQAPDDDFWGRARDAEPDIGAVERQCASPPCQGVGTPGCGDGQCAASESCATCPEDCGACDPGACGQCHAAQFCVDGTCQYVCEGVRVPGDYPDVPSAVSALSPFGGTICVGAGTFTGNVSVQATSALTIQGLSPELTTVEGQVTYSHASGSGEWALRGLTLTGGVRVINTNQNHPVRLDGLRVFRTGTNSNAHGVEVTRSSNRPQVIVDGCDITGTPNSAAVEISDSLAVSTSLQTKVEVRSSFLHDSGFGVRYRRLSGSSFPNTELMLLNNTITDCGVGLLTSGASVSLSLHYYNDVFLGHEVGVDLSHTPNSSVWQNHNAYFGNTTNFAGAAIAGSSTLFANPQLDLLQVPPAPSASSPLIGFGLASMAPALDYWGTTRAEPPTVGAVEGACAAPPCAPGPGGGPVCGDGVCEPPEDSSTCPADCPSAPEVCGPGAGSCFSNNGTPGCDDLSCCATICASDPFCCNNSWDGICATAASNTCD